MGVMWARFSILETRGFTVFILLITSTGANRFVGGGRTLCKICT